MTVRSMRPTRVKVGYITFRITYLSDKAWKAQEGVGEADGGQMDGARAIIYIRDAEQASIHVREILLHEILHACVYVSGLTYENHRALEDIEETFVRTISGVLLDTLVSNPKVANFILGGTQ